MKLSQQFDLSKTTWCPHKLLQAFTIIVIRSTHWILLLFRLLETWRILDLIWNFCQDFYLFMQFLLRNWVRVSCHVHIARDWDQEHDRERDWEQGLQYIMQNCSHCTRTWNGTRPIVSCCASPFPCTSPIPLPVQLNVPLDGFVARNIKIFTISELQHEDSLRWNGNVGSDIRMFVPWSGPQRNQQCLSTIVSQIWSDSITLVPFIDICTLMEKHKFSGFLNT